MPRLFSGGHVPVKRPRTEDFLFPLPTRSDMTSTFRNAVK